MAKPINTESIEAATNKTWDQWIGELDQAGARELSHTDLARLVNEKLEGLVDNPGWWAQSVTVAYEQHTGKRAPGQLANGLFELAVSKAVHEPRSELFPRVVEWFESQPELNGQTSLKPRSTQTPKRSNWRCDFADGSKFSATVEENGDKSKLVLSHTDVLTKNDADAWKDYWKDIADTLAKNSSN